MNEGDNRAKDGRSAENAETAEIEELDVEEYCKLHGGLPPRAKRYKIRVDREKFTVNVPTPSGRQILEIAGKRPPENWLLNQKVRGGQVRPIGLDDTVDLTEPGIERFMTLPKDQTEGDGRRQFELPRDDQQSLESRSLSW